MATIKEKLVSLYHTDPGLVTSLTLHALFIILVSIQLSWPKELTYQEKVVVVDLVAIGEITNLKNQKAGLKSEAKPPLPAKPTSPSPAAKSAANANPSANTAAEAIALKKATTKKTDQDAKRSAKEQKLEQKLLDDLEQQLLAQPTPATQTNKQSSSDKPYDSTLPLSITEKDNIKGQIEQKFINPLTHNFPPNQLVVKLKLIMNPDGSVKSVEVLGSSIYPLQHKNAFITLKENLMRAAYMASPLKNLPLDKYEGMRGWREIELTFDAHHLTNIG